jgi:Ca-activated chloride channel family protein
VVGVGDPTKGSFINGRNSRQDVSALRQMALRLGGAYHDGNKRQVASEVLRSVTAEGDRDAVLKLGRREYALLAAALGAAILALLQPLLRAFGSPWARRRTSWRDPGGLPTGS